MATGVVTPLGKSLGLRMSFHWDGEHDMDARVVGGTPLKPTLDDVFFGIWRPDNDDIRTGLVGR